MKKLTDKYLGWYRKNGSPAVRKLQIVVLPLFFLLLIFVPPSLVRGILSLGIPTPWNIYAGWLIIVPGVFLYLWTILLFAGVMGTQFPIAPTKGLVTSGPYAVTRNPMVTGVILMLAGAGILLNSLSFLILGMVIPGVYLVYIKFWEEKELEARFGEEYREYKKRTPFIIPGFPSRSRSG